MECKKSQKKRHPDTNSQQNLSKKQPKSTKKSPRKTLRNKNTEFFRSLFSPCDMLSTFSAPSNGAESKDPASRYPEASASGLSSPAEEGVSTPGVQTAPTNNEARTTDNEPVTLHAVAQPTTASHPDVLVPHLRVLGDIPGQQLPAGLRLQVADLD